MKTLFFGIFLCLFSTNVHASGGRSLYDTNLIDINQNLLFRPELASFQSAPSYKTAAVHFLANRDKQLGFSSSEPNFQMNVTEQCKKLGYEKTGACGSNEYIAHRCPWDETKYDYCCDLNYAYSRVQCSYPRTVSSDSCSGKFKCYCDRSLYPITSCSAPQIPSEDRCVETIYTNGVATDNVYYTECVCPDNWIQCDASIHQKGNGTACTYRGKTTYASCECESNYTQTCDDYGPRTPSDYCFLKGTKYYKDCKTSKEVCDSAGFKHDDTSNPCSADEDIDRICPHDATYYTCRINPDKYCKNHGFSREGCGKYEETSSETCAYDPSYKKCIKTCKSRIYADNPGYYFDGERSLNGYPMIYTKNVIDNNFSASSSSKYESSYTYRNVYSECANENKPTVTVNTSGDKVTLLSGVDVSDVDLMFNLNNGTNSGKNYNLEITKDTKLYNTSVKTNKDAMLNVEKKVTFTLDGGSDLSKMYMLNVSGSTDGGFSDTFLTIKEAKLSDVNLFGRVKMSISDKSGNSEAKNVYIGNKCEDLASPTTCSRKFNGRSVLVLEEETKFKVTGDLHIDTRWEDCSIQNPKNSSPQGGPALYQDKKSQLITTNIYNTNCVHFISADAISCSQDYWMQNKNDRGYSQVYFGAHGRLLTIKATQYYYNNNNNLTTSSCYGGDCSTVQNYYIRSAFTSSDQWFSTVGTHDKWNVSNLERKTTSITTWNVYCNNWYYKN